MVSFYHKINCSVSNNIIIILNDKYMKFLNIVRFTFHFLNMSFIFYLKTNQDAILKHDHFILVIIGLILQTAYIVPKRPDFFCYALFLQESENEILLELPNPNFPALREFEIVYAVLQGNTLQPLCHKVNTANLSLLLWQMIR